MRRTKEEAEQTRDDILNAAIQLFSEKGVLNTSLEEIAQAASVTRGAIYWHFKNKIEIFDALHDRLHRPMVDMIMQDLEKDHPEPLTQLRELCLRVLQDLETDRLKRQAVTLFLFRCNYTGPLAEYKEIHRAKKAESMKLFCRYFERAQEKGKLPRSADPELLTLAVCCFMKGMMYEYLDNAEGFSINDKAAKLLTLFFANHGACPGKK